MQLRQAIIEREAVALEKEHLQQELESSAQPNGFAGPEFNE